MEKYQVGIIGAGPLGLELAIALKLSGISYAQFEKGQVAQMIYNFPPATQFFSSSERIGIAGIPIQTTDQQKCSRENYLAYIRSVVLQFDLRVNTYEEVTQIEKLEEGGFLLTTHSSEGESLYEVRYLVLATGGTSSPRLLGVPGENLPHVSVKMECPHKYFGCRVMIIGGKNSAAESALRCYHAGAHVCIVNRKEQFDQQDIKYWILPELLGRIDRKEIQAFLSYQVGEIHSDCVILNKQGEKLKIPVDFVIKAIGFDANMELFRQIGVELSSDTQSVLHDEFMQVNVSDVYVLGTIVGGTQKRYRVFIENTHEHVDKIMRSLCTKLSVPMKWKVTSQPIRPRLEE